MKNSLISLGLFLCAIILIFFLDRSLINLCNEIQQKTDIIEQTILENDFETAFDQSMELVDLLKEKNFVSSIYVTHECFDSLVDESVKLSVYIQYNDAVDSNATLHCIKNMTQDMKELQTPTLENILTFTSKPIFK
ncbi:MAG TPA: hypothetical protein DG753_04685 [Clostridium sp.]|nr:hypothetical protein [Clostridium sp.]